MEIITKKPEKQRKFLFQAPYHRRSKILTVHLSSDLAASHNTRALPVRTGDTVRVLRGDRNGLEGKITRVDKRTYKVFVDGFNREKADGTSIPVPVHPSKIQIIKLNLDDKWRQQILKRKGKNEKEEALAKEEKPKAKAGKNEKTAKEKPAEEDSSESEGE